ncbi:MAG: hypothetical protein Q9157_000019 [Trypethelium eluteriae]
MPPKTEGTSLSPQEMTLLMSIIRHKTGNIADMTDWDQVAIDSGYKNVANAKTMFSRLCKNKLGKSDNPSGGSGVPSGGVVKSGTPKAQKAAPKKAKANIEQQTKVKEESDDVDDEEV